MGDEQKWNAPGQELSPLDPHDGAQYLLWGEALSDAVALRKKMGWDMHPLETNIRTQEEK